MLPIVIRKMNRTGGAKMRWPVKGTAPVIDAVAMLTDKFVILFSGHHRNIFSPVGLDHCLVVPIRLHEFL